MASAPDGQGDCAYELDADLCFRSVDARWTEFARTNAAPELCAPSLIGRRLFDCVADPSTAILYRRAFERARESGRPVVLPFRCDSPALRRFMEIEISATGDGGFRVCTRVVRIESREPVALLDATRARSDELLRMCGWCKRVDASGRWLEVEAAVETLRLFEEPTLPRISHGICQECETRLLGALAPW